MRKLFVCAIRIHFILFFVLLLQNQLGFAANEDQFKDVFILYKKGAYVQVLDKLKTIKGNKEVQGTVAYWRGLCDSRLQAYDKAADSFREASRLGVTAPDLDYELGQALYASQLLKPARSAFKNSIIKKYKIGASAYYVAYISQSLEEYDTAMDFYQRLLKLSNDDDHVKQAALFQIAEINDSRAETIKDKKHKLKVLEEEVIPAYEKAESYESDTPSAAQATAKLTQIRNKYFPTKPKNWSLSLSQNFKYDSNVTTQAEQATTAISNNDSFISNTTLFGSYHKNWNNWALTPELYSAFTYNQRHDVPSVFQNDEIDINPAIRGRYAHTMKNKPAAFLLETEFAYSLRDWTKTHSYDFYNRSVQFITGERLAIFSDTDIATVKLKYKMLTSEDPNYSARTPAFEINQMARMFGQDINITASADFQSAIYNHNNDLNTYRLNSSTTLYYLKQWGYTLRPSLSLSLQDTRAQSPTRGLEREIAPGVTASKMFSKHVDGKLDYTYTNHYSKDKQNYAYQKHVVTVGATYSF